LRLVRIDSSEELVEPGAGEGPLEWLGDLAAVLAEAEQSFGERLKRVEFVGGDASRCTIESKSSTWLRTTGRDCFAPTPAVNSHLPFRLF
jgi:hypothetical protein